MYFMKKPSLTFLFLLIFFITQAQKAGLKERKYPSLLWEISGNGLKKPSYLFGTMHVSSKMVFNLSDSFYLAIKSSDVVALETNPESWQEDMFNFNFENDFVGTSYNWMQGLQHAPDDYLTINTLKFSNYEKLIEGALASNPSAINNLLYRTYSEKETDFEEDTYLDLYIYQAGKKWGKKVIGVEKYAESMKLAMEAYLDAMKDKNKKEKTYEAEGKFSYAKLQEAYRAGNLDLLDTINRINSFSPAFDEKFLYRRNEIQAASIDSILKKRLSLFAGVGAAHLPGPRGVIEILRRAGYKLRPIKMGERSSRYKEGIEKITVPVFFTRQTSDDGFYSVDVPGKLFRFSNSFNGFDQEQFADMANGSYYIVTRIQTNASAWGHSSNDVYNKVDSLLYENIPGKILSKKSIIKNGYKGFDIVNKTRRGDFQRYNIFITPFEVLFFKVSGNAEYVSNNSSADNFFKSIMLKEYFPQWKKISPVFGGFEVDMPHEPYVIRNKNWQFLAIDRKADIDFEVIRTDIHNYNFAEEDSFDLALMEESFTASDFYEKTLRRTQTRYKGYPALDAKYQYKDGSVALVRYLLRGPHYYTILTHARTEQPRMHGFLNSFTITPFIYKSPQLHTDTNLHFSVSTPFYPSKKTTIEMPVNFENIYTGIGSEVQLAERAIYRDKLVANDSTGEKIYVSFYKAPRYENSKGKELIKEEETSNDKEWLVRKRKITDESGGKSIWETVLSNANSSRAIWSKNFYRNGVVFSIKTEIDTLTQPGIFLTRFFESFHPDDTINENSSEEMKDVFFADFYSKDTLVHNRALRNISVPAFDSTDLPRLEKAIGFLSWKDRNYLAVKKDFIDQLGTIPSQQASLCLQKIFYAAGDTLDLQYKCLENLLSQQTKFSFGIFRDLVVSDPPILNLGFSIPFKEDFESESFLEGLYDSLELTATIARDLLPLLDIDDYKYPIIQLMATLVDSSLLVYKDYDKYASKFLIEAKQAWKKQLIIEKNRAIEKAQKKIEGEEANEGMGTMNSDADSGNETLIFYTGLLLPLWEKNPDVPVLLKQFLNSNDKQLKYKTLLLFLRNGKTVADSILFLFAASDEYRYDLYKDLHRLKKLSFFPARYNNHVDLAKSKLVNSSKYQTPDTIAFLNHLPLNWAGKEGLVYFFKYKRKKDDAWKIASAGLVPIEEAKFEFEMPQNRRVVYDLDFTEFSDMRFNEEKALEPQLYKRLKQLIYSKKSSAKKFYMNNEEADSNFRDFSN